LYLWSHEGREVEEPRTLDQDAHFSLAHKYSTVLFWFHKVNDCPASTLFLGRRVEAQQALMRCLEVLRRFTASWGWPSWGRWPDWWGDFIDRLIFLPSGEPRFAAPGLPAYVPVHVELDDAGRSRLHVSLPGSTATRLLDRGWHERASSIEIIVRHVAVRGRVSYHIVLFPTTEGTLEGFKVYGLEPLMLSPRELDGLERGIDVLEAAMASAPDTQADHRRTRPDGCNWDEAMVERNRYIYCESVNGTPYGEIMYKVSIRVGWSVLESVQGVQKAGRDYARVFGGDPIPARKRGRPKQRGEKPSG
jgi:hypothetical protein